MKKKIFIYQNGFIEDEECLKPLIDLVIKRDNTLSTLFSDVFYLDNFIKYKDQFKEETSKAKFKTSFDKLNKLIIESKFNTVHVVTSLIGPKGVDDLFLGTQKLIYLIKNIKEIMDVDVILVGHSQGGLLNLIVATSIPTLIKDMISIVTPYRESFFGGLVKLGINLSKVLFYKNPLRLLTKKGRYNEEDIKKMEVGIRLLSNRQIYSKYRHLWANLKNKPHLYVVSSLAGLIKYSNSKVYFDGILTLKEQNDIDAYQRIILLDPSIKNLNIEEEMQKTLKIKENINDVPLYDATYFKNKLIKCALKHPYLRYDNEFYELAKILKEALLLEERTIYKYDGFDKLWRNDFNHYTIRNDPHVVDLIISLM